MKKAFTLFEMIITLLLLGVIFVVFSKPLINMTRLYAHSSQNTISTALLFIDKIAQNCLELSFTAQGFECLLKDEANLILHRGNNAFIGSSGIVLQDENSSFYAPKSHFLYEIQNDKGKKIQVGVLENQKDLHKDKNKDFVYLYAIKERQIYKAQISNGEKINFSNGEFTGFYDLIDAKISITLNAHNLIYEYSPYLQGLSYTSLLAQNIKEFTINQNGDELAFTICSFDDFCLQKWVRR